jgi:hypothetical protein
VTPDAAGTRVGLDAAVDRAIATDAARSQDDGPAAIGMNDAIANDASATVADVRPADLGGPETIARDSLDNDAGAPADEVALFVAQGYLGRTVVSCDDGRTWVGNRSADDRAICFTPTLDCDHNAGAGRGIAYGNGWFVATFGWGPPGGIRRSRDGVAWDTVTSNTTFAGVVFGNGQFLAGGRPAWVADAQGAGWRMAGNPSLATGNVRRSGFVPHGGGLFLLHANDGGTNDTMLSSDDGKTWWRPRALPAECGTDQWSGGFAYGNGIIVMMNGQGVACRSGDGGMTFTAARLGGNVDGRLLWTGSEFMTWGARGVYRSADGATWASQPTVPAILAIGPVARSDGGTFVAIRGGWQTWYDKQQFYRSRDGVSWEVLPTGAFPASHPMTFIAWGRGQRPQDCR